MGWFQVSQERLSYRGRITRGPLERWFETNEGAEVVARAARDLRFRLLGRRRAARKEIWHALRNAASTEPLLSAIQQEANYYLAEMASVSYPDPLPRAHIALHRLVVVPRAMIASRARAAMHERLGAAPELLEFDEAVRLFFLEQLLVEMDSAMQEAQVSPRRPVHAQDEWACVGIQKELIWIDPMWSGASWTGHVFMYEFPRQGLSRRDRKALEQSIADLSARASSLSKSQRGDLLRAAASLVVSPGRG